MTERDKYICAIWNRLTLRDQLEQLAEEAAELSQAALKLIRARELSGNKTPVSAEDAQAALEEEVIDVLIAFDTVFNCDFDALMDAMRNSPKWQRWAERLGTAHGREEAQS